MKTIIKLFILNLFWLLAVKLGGESDQVGTHFIIFGAALLIVLGNYKCFETGIKFGHYLFALFIFTLYGYLQDFILGYFQLVDYPLGSVPLWLTSLWVIFLCYYGDIFNKFNKLSTPLVSFIGGGAGAFAFYSGTQLAGLSINTTYYLTSVFISWAIFFPMSMAIFYRGFMWNKILDASIYYSFDKSGYLRHEKTFSRDERSLEGKSVLITGGTSGIGKYCCEFFKDKNASVYFTGRNELRGGEIESTSELLSFVKLDMANWDEIDHAIKDLPVLDSLVLNAGGMPEEFTLNKFNIEMQMASQLFGHYFLLKKLYENKKLSSDARVVWVTSGGMYLSQLSLDHLHQNDNYNKVSTYAVVKRAQVSLLEHFKAAFPDISVVAMHPGWVNTPGVQSAISGFYEKMKDRLRTPHQGADTILWLIMNKSLPTSGELYFDRRIVKKNFFPWVRVNKKVVDALWDKLNSEYKRS